MRCGSQCGGLVCLLDAGHAGKHRGVLKMNGPPPTPPRHLPIEWSDAPPLPPPPAEPLILIVRS